MYYIVITLSIAISSSAEYNFYIQIEVNSLQITATKIIRNKMVSVIVITYNRELFIKECIDNILSQDFAGELEVIVIDNYSSDSTAVVLKNMPDPRVKFIVNKTRVGLSACKNLGLRLSHGNMIAFTDDDCLVSRNWLKNITDSLKQYDFAGGVVLPLPGSKFPWWWNNSLNWLVGINPEPNKKFLPLGSNMAFNKRVLDKLEEGSHSGLTSINLALPYREDNYRIQKALASGFSMGINKGMVVYHRIPKTRLNIAYLLKRSYDEGYVWIMYEKRLWNLVFSFCALPINFIRLLISWNINYFFRFIVNISYISNYIVRGYDVKRY